MEKKFQSYFIILFLCILGLSATIYKVVSLDFPLFPGGQAVSWTVESKITFDADGEEAKVTYAKPISTSHLRVISTHAVSSGYGYEEKDGQGIWTKRQADGKQSLYFQAIVHQQEDEDATINSFFASKPKGSVRTARLDSSQKAAASEIIGFAKQRSTDERSLVTQMVKVFRTETLSDSVAYLRKSISSEQATVDLAKEILILAGIHVKEIKGVFLSKGREKEKIRSILGVFVDDKWAPFDVISGEFGVPANFLPFGNTSDGVLVVEGGNNSKVEVTSVSDGRSAQSLTTYHAQVDKDILVDFSIYSLPAEQQKTFKLLLLMPIGALVVVFFRNIVGLKTSGTFMPILIALTFLQTTLTVGLALFVIVVGIGLLLRSYLTHLNLLLVPRISAVLIVVTLIFAMISILGFKLGMENSLAVTFFPMIIVSWTIERMSVLWDESGAKEVFVQTFGSLFVASIAYFMMSSVLIKHLTFLFPELLLVVLAVILLLGQLRVIA
ncbi:UUP1 family membrane protein [Curvivirga aplysinae]|uniref:UUP1 family membrane protein n=1 Tax=Curvivirga aplysinae TaxID=2529852 RepID=UPI0012BCFB51|nr:UUP1 family membrane protein [Curvivirga aplysinae]MTI08392.1 hypothetical protein [Curvivirga aplysinae]